MMNFSQINSGNNSLLKEINKYSDLKQKVSDFKSLENQEKEDNNDNKEDNKKELNLKLFLVNHPLINLFKDEIDIIKLKDEIKKEYLKGMKDNTNYKPGPPNPHLINILEQNVSANEENEEENEGEIDEVAVSLVSEPSGEALEEPDVVIYDNHSEEDEEDPVLEIAPNPNNQVQAVENHENINENQNIQQEHEEQNLPNNIFAFDEIQPIQPIQPLEPIQPMQQLEPEQPMQPLEPEQPLEPLQPPQNDINIQEILPMPIIDQNLNYRMPGNNVYSTKTLKRIPLYSNLTVRKGIGDANYLGEKAYYNSNTEVVPPIRFEGYPHNLYSSSLKPNNYMFRIRRSQKGKKSKN